jgi:mannan endo-1,4-beta-mannosidase
MRSFTLLAFFLASTLSSFAIADIYPKISKANNFRFEIGNSSKYFTGTNAYWLPFLANNDDIDLALDHIAAAGLKVVRTWGFNDVNEIPSPGEHDMYIEKSAAVAE